MYSRSLFRPFPPRPWFLSVRIIPYAARSPPQTRRSASPLSSAPPSPRVPLTIPSRIAVNSTSCSGARPFRSRSGSADRDRSCFAAPIHATPLSLRHLSWPRAADPDRGPLSPPGHALRSRLPARTPFTPPPHHLRPIHSPAVFSPRPPASQVRPPFLSGLPSR